MQRFWPHFFLISILEGLAALAALFSIPSEGLSLARLALVGVILLPLAVSGWMFFRSLNADWRVRWLDATAAHTERSRSVRAIVIFSSLLFLTSGLLLFLLRYLNPEATASYFVRARPALAYLLLLAAQTALWLAALRNGIRLQILQTRRAVFVSAGIVFAIFVVIWLIIFFTGLGITKDTSYWGEPGVPILGWQLLLVLLIGFVFVNYQLPITIYHLPSSFSRRTDLLLPLLIWLLALGLWMSVPLTSLRNSFYAPIQPPYSQPFPASDASYYDSDAQSLLMGYGFVHPIPTRPLFILFLTGLHALLGQEYARLILGQTLVFALLPVALYFLGKKLRSRAAGLTVALLATFRELTSLWVASDARVSNTKMLLSEFITTLVLIVYLLLVLRWFREKRGGPLLAFASGGALGLQLLLRTQSAFLAPGVILLALFVFWPDWKRWFAHSAVFAAGLLLAVSPWLARNYAVTGQASLDDPTQIKAVASMYSGGSPTSNFPQFEGQSPGEISRFVVDTILQRPGYVAGFVANQFLANGIDTLLVLPIFARYDGLTAPIYLYWYEWDGHPSLANILLFIVYLSVVALGLAAAWKRLRWAGLLPLVTFIFYAFSTSLARYSGWRYIFPVDWVGYFYFALGAVEVFSLTALLFGAHTQVDRYTGTQVHTDTSKQDTYTGRHVDTYIGQPATPNPQLATPNSRHAISRSIPMGLNTQYATRNTHSFIPSPLFWTGFHLSSFILLIFLGSLPWIVESAIPSAKPLCADSIPACLAAQGVDESQARAFLGQPGAVTLTGRALYPRYFPRNAGLASTNPNPAFAPRGFPRMGFYFLTPDGVEQVILPMKGSRPFPHAADGILLGCQRGNYVEARLLLFPATGEMFVSQPLERPCEPP